LSRFLRSDLDKTARETGAERDFHGHILRIAFFICDQRQVDGALNTCLAGFFGIFRVFVGITRGAVTVRLTRSAAIVFCFWVIAIPRSTAAFSAAAFPSFSHESEGGQRMSGSGDIAVFSFENLYGAVD